MKTVTQIADILAPHIMANNGSVGETNRRLAKIGDGEGNSRPSTLLTPRDVLYRSTQDQDDRGVAILAPKCPISIDAIEGYYDTEVWVANVPGSSQIQIVDIADAGGNSTGGPTPQDGANRAAAFPSQDRLLILRLRPSVGGGISVYVDGGPDAISYEVPGGYAFYHSTDFGFPDPMDESVFVPTVTALLSGEHRLVGIALSPDTGGLIAIPGTATTADDTLPSRSEFTESDYLAIDFTGYYPAGYVYTWYGQTDVVEDDCLRLYDPRVLLNKMGNSGSSLTVTDGSTTVTPAATITFPSGTITDLGGGDAEYVPSGDGSNYQTVQVDGTPQTQRTTLDLIAGTNITLTPADDSVGNRTKVTIDASGGGGGSPVIAKYITATVQAFANNTSTTINYDTLVTDTDGAVTIGSGWKFTAPRTAHYQVNCALLMQSGNQNQSIEIWVNGSLYASPTYGAASFGSATHPHGSVLVPLTSGDYLQIKIYQFVGGSENSYGAGNTPFNYVDIFSVD